MVDEKYVRERITQLRLKKGVSEYKMSYDLGHSRSYIHNISSAKSIPPLKELFQICDYFGISPAEFFNENIDNPALLQMVIDESKNLDDEDLLLVLSLIKRLSKR